MDKLLKQIQESANEALKLAHKKHCEDPNDGEFKSCAINWGDLRCTDVKYCASVDGDETYQVEIEEAAPDSWNLEQFVKKHVQENIAGLGDSVSVRTEW